MGPLDRPMDFDRNRIEAVGKRNPEQGRANSDTIGRFVSKADLADALSATLDVMGSGPGVTIQLSGHHTAVPMGSPSASYRTAAANLQRSRSSSLPLHKQVPEIDAEHSRLADETAHEISPHDRGIVALNKFSESVSQAALMHKHQTQQRNRPTIDAAASNNKAAANPKPPSKELPKFALTPGTSSVEEPIDVALLDLMKTLMSAPSIKNWRPPAPAARADSAPYTAPVPLRLVSGRAVPVTA